MLSLLLLLLLVQLPASFQQTCDLMMMGKVDPVRDLIDSALPNLGLCARGPGWSESGRLQLTSSSQGNRRVGGENFNQVWWTSLVKRPNCVTKLAIFVNGVELTWLTEPREPLNFQSSIPTTEITLRLFYKDPIPMFPDKCFELRIHFESPVTESEPANNFERRQDQVGAEFRTPQDDGPARHSSNYLFPPGPRSSVEDVNLRQEGGPSRNRGRSLIPPRNEGQRPNIRNPIENSNQRSGNGRNNEGTYLPPHPNLQPPSREFIYPPESYEPTVRRGRRLFPPNGQGSRSSVEDFGPTVERDADAVNFPQPGRELPPPVETITEGVVDTPKNRDPGGVKVRSNFPSNPVDESPDSGHKENVAVDVEIVMGTVGILAILLVGVLTLVVRRMKKQKATSDQVKSGKGEVWSSTNSKRRKQEKSVENCEEYFVDDNYENDSQCQNDDELYENDNLYQNT